MEREKSFRTHLPLPSTESIKLLVDSEEGRVYLKRVFKKLAVGVAAMTNGGKERGIYVNKSKKHSVAPSDAKGKRKWMAGKFLDV